MRRVMVAYAALASACANFSDTPGLDANEGVDATAADVSSADAAATDAGANDVGLDAGAEPDATAPDAGATPDASLMDAGGADAEQDQQAILFVHGINGSSADFALMVERLAQDGWPRDHLRAITFPDPSWGCNVDNAEIVRQEVDSLLASTGASRVDIVAHSMGTLSSRYYVKNLGGTEKVSTYVTLGGLHHGQQLSCLNPLPVCVWQELCPTKPYLTQLNADPATPPPVHWVSIYSRSDATATPSVAYLDGAENIEFDGVDHAGANGLTESLLVYPEVKRVLEYPSP